MPIIHDSLINHIPIFELICTYLYLFHRTTSPICSKNKINLFLVRRKVFTWAISNYWKIKKRLIIFLAPLSRGISYIIHKKLKEQKIKGEINMCPKKMVMITKTNIKTSWNNSSSKCDISKYKPHQQEPLAKIPFNISNWNSFKLYSHTLNTECLLNAYTLI